MQNIYLYIFLDVKKFDICSSALAIAKHVMTSGGANFAYYNVARIFVNDYDVVDVFDNDRSAIISRIDYIERNEPRRSFLNIF